MGESSIFSVDKNSAKEVIKHLERSTFGNKKIRVEVSKEKVFFSKPKSSGSRRRSDGRSNRGFRGNNRKNKYSPSSSSNSFRNKRRK